MDIPDDLLSISKYEPAPSSSSLINHNKEEPSSLLLYPGTTYTISVSSEQPQLSIATLPVKRKASNYHTTRDNSSFVFEKSYHSVTCHSCGTDLERKPGQQAKQIMYVWIDQMIIEQKDSRFERFLDCVAFMLYEPPNYTETRISHFKSLGILKPYDIIINFVDVKELPLYARPFVPCRLTPTHIIPPPTAITKRMSDLEAKMLLEASAYWVSKIHLFDELPIYIKNGLPVEQWWIECKERYAAYGKKHGTNTVKNDMDKIFFSDFTAEENK